MCSLRTYSYVLHQIRPRNFQCPQQVGRGDARVSADLHCRRFGEHSYQSLWTPYHYNQTGNDFAQTMVHQTHCTYCMVTRTSQVLIFAAFKHHTIKKMLGNTLRVPERIRKMFGQVMISEAQMHQSDHSPIEIPTEQTSFMILSLNVQVNATSRHRPLQYLLRQHSYPPVIFLQEIGKVSEKYLFHPLYTAYHTQVAVNSVVMLARLFIPL